MTGQEMIYPPMDEWLATDEQFGTSIEQAEVGDVLQAHCAAGAEGDQGTIDQAS